MAFGEGGISGVQREESEIIAFFQRIDHAGKTLEVI
jgi:hypothetical protein